MAAHTRSGGPSKLKLERYAEALSDPSSGLTYPAFVGSRKQSVVDAERCLILSWLLLWRRKVTLLKPTTLV